MEVCSSDLSLQFIMILLFKDPPELFRTSFRRKPQNGTDGQPGSPPDWPSEIFYWLSSSTWVKAAGGMTPTFRSISLPSLKKMTVGMDMTP